MIEGIFCSISIVVDLNVLYSVRIYYNSLDRTSSDLTASYGKAFPLGGGNFVLLSLYTSSNNHMPNHSRLHKSLQKSTDARTIIKALFCSLHRDPSCKKKFHSMELVSFFLGGGDLRRCILLFCILC